MSLQGVVGINKGYVEDGHDGLNHVQVRANTAYHPVPQMEIYAYTGYNQAIDADAARYVDDELLDDFVWGGIGMTYRF